MGSLFQADLAFLFEQPSVWRSLVQALIVMLPLAFALAGLAAVRMGNRGAWLLVGAVALYLMWMFWPQPLAPSLVLPGRMVSVIGWFWLLQAWARRVSWHEPLLLWTNSLVVALLIALVLTTGVAGVRDLMGWDIVVTAPQG